MQTRSSDAAIEELYRTYADDVFRFALYLTGNWAAAQDVTSETFVRAWTARSTVQVSTAKAYLFVIARNLCRDNLRQRRPEVEPGEELRAAETPAGDAYEQRAELARTLADLQLITAGDRDALVMAVIEEMSYEDVARALAISVGSVKSRVFRARLRLQELRQQRLQRR